MDKLTIEQVRLETGMLVKDVAALFGLKYESFAKSTARKRYERAIVRFYEIVKKQQENKNGNDGTN